MYFNNRCFWILDVESLQLDMSKVELKKKETEKVNNFIFIKNKTHMIKKQLFNVNQAIR